jgi:hypothetical protein
MSDEQEVGYVYFIFGFNSDHILCKIGWSIEPYRRLKTIQTASPFKVSLAALVENATKSDERWYHKHFSEYHVYGEWFNLKDALLQFLIDNSLIWVNRELYDCIVEGAQEWRNERGMPPYVRNGKAVCA